MPDVKRAAARNSTLKALDIRTLFFKYFQD